MENQGKVVSRVLSDGTYVLLDLGSGKYHTLNPMGGVVWSCLKDGMAAGDVADYLRDHCGESTADSVSDDVARFAAELGAMGLIQPTPSTDRPATKKPLTPGLVYQTPALESHDALHQVTAGSSSGGGYSYSYVYYYYTYSDVEAKREIRPVNADEVLDRLASIPMHTWEYKADAAGVRHLGPMAQDFAAAFGLGDSERHIHVVDGLGVALTAIQSLHTRLLATEEALRQSREETQSVRQLLTAENNSKPA